MSTKNSSNLNARAQAAALMAQFVAPTPRAPAGQVDGQRQGESAEDMIVRIFEGVMSDPRTNKEPARVAKKIAETLNRHKVAVPKGTRFTFWTSADVAEVCKRLQTSDKAGK